jgi:hypothetical protein
VNPTRVSHEGGAELTGLDVPQPHLPWKQPELLGILLVAAHRQDGELSPPARAIRALLVALEPDADERPRQMAVNFYPADPELVPNTLLLQYFIVLPVKMNAAGAARTRWQP